MPCAHLGLCWRPGSYLSRSSSWSRHARPPVIGPLRRIAHVSDEISKGNLEIAEFEERGAEEIRQLEASFNRMRRSIEKAIRLVHPAKGSGTPR